jgi:hypothetical protein
VTHFNAGSVSAIPHGGGAGRGNGTTNAPKFYAGTKFDASILAGFFKNTNRKNNFLRLLDELAIATTGRFRYNHS